MTNRSSSLAALVVIAAGAVGFWYFCIIRPAWLQPYSASMGNVDFFTQIYPMSFRAAAWMRQGIMPLWNPFQSAGYPFLATGLYGVCYPPNVLYLLLPTEIAIEAVVVMHVALAGWFTWLYAGVVGVGTVGRFAGAAVYMFCGFTASQMTWFTPAVASATWLPLGLFAVERILQRREVRDAALLAVAVALALLGGWVQFWLYTVYAIAVYAGVSVAVLATRAETRPYTVRIVALLAVGMSLGVAVTAVQILPTRELQALGPRRPGGLDNFEQLVPLGPLHPKRILTEALDARAARPYTSPFYLGPLVIGLAALSIFSRRGAARLAAVWVLFVVSCLVSVSLYTPFFEHVYLHLPAARWFRIPQRIVFLFAFTAAVLTAFGADALTGNERSRRLPKTAVGLAALAACAAVLLALPTVPGDTMVLVGLAMAALAVAVFAPSDRLRVCMVGALVVMVVVNFARETSNPFHHPYHSVARLHQEDEVFQYIRDHQGLDRTYLHDKVGFDFAITAKQGSLQGIYSIGDYEPLSLLRFAEFVGLMSKVRGPAFPFTGWFNVEPQSLRRHLLQALSVRYWLVGNTNTAMVDALSAPGSPWQRVELSKPRWKYSLFEHRAPLPRAYVATHALVVADHASGLAALQAPGFSLATTVVLEPDEDLAAPPSAGTVPAPVIPARITRYEPTEVVIEADAAEAGYLVLTDTYYPGWWATVDGVAAPIYPANHVVRAVAIAAGHHTVVFRYAPTSVRVGACVSAVALLALMWMAITNRPRPRALGAAT